MPGGPSPYDQLPAGMMKDVISELMTFDPGQLDWTKIIPQVPVGRLQVCPPVCPEGYVPPGQSPPTSTPSTPKPAGSALPLVIGAALLLLS